MPWNVFVTRRIPAEGLDVLRKADVKIDLHDDEEPLPTAQLLRRLRTAMA